MLRFLADEDFNRIIVRGVLRARPEIDIVRVQDIGLRTENDPEVLDLAAAAGRILLTHDEQTMPAYAYERVLAGLVMRASSWCNKRNPSAASLKESSCWLSVV